MGNERSSGPLSSRSNNAIRDGRTAAPMRPNQQTNTGDGKGLQNQQNTQGQMNIKCYRCFEPGHKSNECPKRTNARVNLAEDGEVEENFGGFDDGNQHLRVNDLDGVKEEGIDGDLVGETLVTRRSMFAPLASNKDDWLRKNIFRTRCTVGGKLCNLIIDSGSSENLVAQEMVDKLKLKTEGHPHPYRILWFNKGNEVNVSSRCLVSFSIGSFKDDVYCDVVPMDACHILLGRPWQYDRGTMHDGTLNTYSFFVKNGDRKKKLVLKPMKDDQFECTRRGCSSLLLNSSDFMEQSRETEIVYVLIWREKM